MKTDFSEVVKGEILVLCFHNLTLESAVLKWMEG